MSEALEVQLGQEKNDSVPPQARWPVDRIKVVDAGQGDRAAYNSHMRKAGRALLAVSAFGFGYLAYIYLTLPDVRPLRNENPRTTAFMELRARQARDRGEQPRRVQRWVPYARISYHLKDAVRVAEDSLFWQHDGLDYQQIKESMEVNLERLEFKRGASTITQQLAKNLYLSPSKNPVRKLKELLITRRLEAELTKQRIYELYLNLIEWGDGVYGAEAAARTHFRKSAAELSAQESALLASAIINPRVLDPGRPSARLHRRQQLILRRMGWMPPPPVIAEPGQSAPAADAPPVQALPAAGPPTEMPGEVIPAAPKPPGGRGGGQ